MALCAVALPATASASSVAPQFVAGNPACADYGLKGVKVDSSNVAGNFSDGTLSVHVEQAGNGGKITSWTSSIGVDKVIVKGGAGSAGGTQGSNVYGYDPEATSDSDLVAPNNTGLSHVEFCYDTSDSPATPPPSDTSGGGTTTTTTQTPPPADAPQQPAPAGQQAVAPDQQQAAAPDAADRPAQLVLGERISGGTARLVAPTGCQSRAFNARVRGSQIARVVFTLDGKRIKTVTKGAYALRVNPANYRVGVHRLVVKVTFTAASHTKTRTLRVSFQRCGQRLVMPRFTG